MRRWAERGAAATLLGAVLLGLIGQAGRVSVRADAVNFLAPVWLACGLVAAILILILGRRRRARLTAGGALLFLMAVATTLLGRPASPAHGRACPGETLTLVQFNIFKNNADVAAATAWIRQTRADVVTIEEASADLPIAALLHSDYPFVVGCLDQGGCSTIILSRRRFVAAGGLARDDPENRKGLSAAWATLPSRHGRFTIVAAHLSRPWPWHASPAEQPQLIGFIRGLSGGATILAGDFNLPAESFQTRRFTADTGLARARDLRTWPASDVLPAVLAIDHIFIGPRWSVEDISRGPKLGSDHYPLVARLRLEAAMCPKAG